MSITHDSFGAVLHSLRARERMKQSELARQLHVHRNTVGAWERGDYLPDLTTVHELVRVLRLAEEDALALFAAHSTKNPLIIPGNLPSLRNPLFTGREQTLQHVHEILQASPACSLRGLAGMGKTQTALEYAYRFHQAYRSLFWVQAENHETILSSYLSIADLLDLPEKQEADQVQVEKAVNRWLQIHAGWLLIYDNVEDFDLLARVLPVARAGAILLTTRSQATGGMFPSIKLEAMPPDEATLLLLRRARLVQGDRPGSHLVPREQASAAMLVEQVGGLPLALDQAGAYIEENQCSVERYLALYQNHRQVLLRERGALPSDHPASVESTFLMSFDKVQRRNPAAADLLRFCAFLAPEAIPEELLWQESGIADPELHFLMTDALGLNAMFRDLLSYSLIQRHPGTKTISMHRLVQEVLQDEMDLPVRRIWIARAVHRLNQLFPHMQALGEDWPTCERLLPHALVCARLSESEKGLFPEAAPLCLKVAGYLRERDRYPEAIALTSQALEICKQVLGPEHLEVAECLNELGILYRIQGNYAEAEQFYQQALAIRERELGMEHEFIAETLFNLSVLAWSQQDYQKGEQLLRRARAVFEQTVGQVHYRTAATISYLARFCAALGRHPEAELLHRQALDIREQELGSSHQHVAMSLNHLAAFYCHLGRYAEAEPLLHRALRICEQQEIPDTLSLALSLSCLGQFYRDLGRYEEADLRLQQAQKLTEQALGASHPETVTTLLNLAELYRLVGNYEQARSLCQRALVATEEGFGTHHPRTSECFTLLGVLYRDQKQFDQAEMLLQQALGIYERTLPSTDPRLPACLHELGVLYQALGKDTQAEVFLQRTLSLREAQFGSGHPRTAETLSALAQLYRDGGRLSEAEMFSGRALSIARQTLGSNHPLTRRIVQLGF